MTLLIIKLGQIGAVPKEIINLFLIVDCVSDVFNFFLDRIIIGFLICLQILNLSFKEF